MKKIGLVISGVLISVMALAGPTDSIGTKVKNGKIFIMHKVEKAQGLYSISRRYNVSLTDIIEHNPGSDETLYLDQVILVPTGKDAPMEEKVVKDYFKADPKTSSASDKGRKSTFAKYHVVQKGETLYSISVLYDTKVDVIKELNNLETNEIKEGTELMVPSTETAKNDQQNRISDAHKKVDSLKREIDVVRNNVASNTNADAKQASNAVNANGTTYQKRVEKLEDYDFEKIWERGVVQDLTEDHGKRAKVCSHHTAEIGTTIMVTNPDSKKAVFVKVVANHNLDPLKGNNIIKLSPAALDYVSLQNGQPVEISFAR